MDEHRRKRRHCCWRHRADWSPAAADRARGGQPLDTDYSDLRLATSTDGGLQYATKDEKVLDALRNGLRMSLAGAPEIDVVGGPAAVSDRAGGCSRTTVQVAGVDEADLVKYDGHHVYAVIPKPAQSADAAPRRLIRNVLKVVSTDPTSTGMQVVSEFTLAGEHSSLPLLYQVQSSSGNTEYLAAVSQDYQAWCTPCVSLASARTS